MQADSKCCIWQEKANWDIKLKRKTAFGLSGTHGYLVNNSQIMPPSTFIMLYIFIYYAPPPPIFLSFTCKIPITFLHVFTSRVENSVDPDQLASLKPTDLDPLFFKT